MEHIIKKLKNAAKNTRLTTVEKAAMKSQLIHYARTHTEKVSSYYTSPTPSPFSLKSFRNKKTLSTFIIGSLLIGSTMSFAAENTVPGDILYPVKIHVNEPVLGAMAVTPEAKALWSVTQSERRLNEVEKLAAQPNVSTEIKDSAELNFSASTNNVEEHISKLEKNSDSTNAIKIAGDLTAMLRKHEKTLGSKSTDTLPVISSIKKTETVHVASQINQKTEEVHTVTSTSTSITQNIQEEGSFTQVLKSVRGARGTAERIETELHNKYDGREEATMRTQNNEGTSSKKEDSLHSIQPIIPEIHTSNSREEIKTASPETVRNSDRNSDSHEN